MEKEFLKLPNILMLIKQKSLLFPRNLALVTFDVSAIPSLINIPELMPASDDFFDGFSKNSNLDNLGISLSGFSSRTNLKFHNISKLVKTVITNFGSSTTSGPDCVPVIPVVVLKNCELELSYILARLFNKCLKQSCFLDFSKALSVVNVFNNVEESSIVKKYCHVGFFSIASKVFEKLANKRLFVVKLISRKLDSLFVL